MDTVYARLRHIAGRAPSKAAVIVDGERYSYSDLIRAIDADAARLTKHGVGVGDSVGLLFGNSYSFVVACFATLAVGARLVPLNPQFASEELEYYFDNAEIKWLYHPAGHALSVGYTESRKIPGVDQLAEAAAEVPLPEQNFNAEDSGLYMFSSGSTGKSKRVTRHQANLLCEFDAIAERTNLDGSDVYLCTIPLYHTHGFGNALFASLLSGSTLVILTHEFNARKTVTAMEEYGVSIYPAVPFMLQIIAMTRFKEAPVIDKLRLVISAGAPLTDKIYQQFLEKTGVGISQLYGSTETGAVTVNMAPAENGFMGCGHPLPGMQVEIRDETGKVLANGEEGEVWVSSGAATKAYDGLPELTQECSVGEFFFLGDLGVFDASGLTIKGRKKLLVNVAGNKVDPLELEELLNQHDNIEEAVVVGKPHDVYGEQLKAYLVAKDQSVPVSQYAEYLKQHLVEYKIPREFQYIDEIPKSPLGKILRKYL